MSESSPIQTFNSSSGKPELSPGKYRERLHQILSKAKASQEQFSSPVKNSRSSVQQDNVRERTVSVDISSIGRPKAVSRQLQFETNSPAPSKDDKGSEELYFAGNNDSKPSDLLTNQQASHFDNSSTRHHKASQSLIETNSAKQKPTWLQDEKQGNTSQRERNMSLPKMKKDNDKEEREEKTMEKNQLDEELAKLPELLELLEKTPQHHRVGRRTRTKESTELNKIDDGSMTPADVTRITSEVSNLNLDNNDRKIRERKTKTFSFVHLPSWFKETSPDATVCQKEVNANGNGNLLHVVGLPTAATEFLLAEDLLYALLGIPGRMTNFLLRVSAGQETNTSISSNPAVNLGCRILPLVEDLKQVQSFINEITYESGLVKQAISRVLRSMVNEYYRRIVSMEVDALSDPNIRGGLALGTLYSIATELQGDQDAHEITKSILKIAFEPLIDFLSLWLYSGVIHDPYEEFFIIEQEKYKKWEQDQILDDAYWELRFVLRKSQLPSFFRQAASKILTAGKFKCAMQVLQKTDREDVSVMPISIERESTNEDILQDILSRIEERFVSSSQELYSILCDRFKLISRLAFLKHYMLLSRADFLGHFLDSAQDELNKPIAMISTESLNALLALSVRSCPPCSETEAFADDLSCRLMPQSLTSQLLRIIHLNDATEGTMSNIGKDDLQDIFGYEAFSLDCRTPFPLSIVISNRMLTKYQLLFRHLFACKIIHRKLEDAWMLLKMHKKRCRHAWMSNSYIIFHRMIHFLDSVLYYDFMEVIEPHWKAMENALRSCEKLEFAIQKHHDFLDTILKQCMLTNPKLLKTQSKLLNACVMFSNWIQQVMTTSTISITETEETITKIGNYFTSQLQVLTESLSAFSLVDAEPHLSNLCTRLNFNDFLLPGKTHSSVD
eukprot:jgi/Galph1/4155/GphlegSOOS_G2864.1